MRGVLIALLGVTVIRSAAAQTDQVYGDYYKTDRNWEVYVKISGVPADDFKVSGTKVEFTVEASTRMIPVVPGEPPPPPIEDPHWNWHKVTEVSLTIGGQTVTLPVPVGATDPYTKVVRFASTHFADGSPQEIVFKAKIKLGRVGQEDIGNPNPIFIEEGPIIDLTDVGAKVKPQMYNKGLTLASKEEYWINPATQPPTGQNEFFSPLPPYPDPGYSYPDGWSPNSHRGADEALVQFPLMKHGVLNPSGNKLLRESDLSTHFKQSTAFFGFTHGGTTYFRSCEIDELVFSFPSSEVRGYVTSGRTVPPHNLVVMHACCTCGGSGNAQYHAGWSFDVSNIPASIPGRAYAGFTTVVWSLGWLNHPIDLHAKYVYQKLAAGWTIKNAAAFANSHAKAKSATGAPLDMVVRGDLYSRLVLVYTGNDDLTTWFFGASMTTAFLCVVAFTNSYDVTVEQARARADQFLLRAFRGIETQSPPLSGEPHVGTDDEFGYFEFTYREGLVCVSKRSGKVRFASPDHPAGTHDWPVNAISEAIARRLAQEYFEAAGFSESLYTHLVERWNEAPPYYRLFSSPKYNGIPYALNHHVEFKIDAATGKLRGFGASRDWPSPPAHTTPLITTDEARAAMAQKIFDLDPLTSNPFAGPRRSTSIEEFFSVRLNIWLPDTGHRTSWPLAEHIADEQAGRGRLVYTAAFQDTDAPLVEEGVHARRFEVYVDARSGRVLCVYLMVPMGGGPSESTTENPLEVKPCTLDVIASGKPVRVGTVSIKPTEPPEHPGKNHSVILRIGKRLLHLKYVPELGLLSTRGEAPSWGRPDERLLRVLKRVLPK